MTEAHSDLEELEHALRVCDQARVKLSLALDRALGALEKMRGETAGLKARLQASDGDFARERAKFLEEMNKALETAEQIRREGIEALEEARDLRRKG